MDDQIAGMLKALGGIAPRFDEAISTALHVALPGRDVIAVYHDDAPQDETLWLITDIGLGRCATWKDAAGKAHAALEICPWRDVINPELTVEVIQMETGKPSTQVKLVIQIPRMSVTATSTERSARLSTFAGEVLSRTG